MKFLIYARSMTGRNKPDLQIECDSIERADGVLLFGRWAMPGVGMAQDRFLGSDRYVAAMAPGTWGIVTTEDGLKMFESEPEPMFPDPGKETP